MNFTLKRASVLGSCVGMLASASATVASLMPYSLEKSVSRTPAKFGKGAMAPLLTLSIPGSAALVAGIAMRRTRRPL